MKKINSRAKGASAERELIALLQEHLGDEIAGELKRNLEQTRSGGHDISGLPGWAIEVKRYASLSEAELIRIWEKQVVRQAQEINARPALAYRADRKPWRFRVPLRLLTDLDGNWMESFWSSSEWTAEIGIEPFCSLIREQHSALVLRSVDVGVSIAA